MKMRLDWIGRCDRVLTIRRVNIPNDTIVHQITAAYLAQGTTDKCLAPPPPSAILSACDLLNMVK